MYHISSRNCGFKNIYKSVTAEEAYMELDRFANKWYNKYSTISRMWKNNWENIS